MPKKCARKIDVVQVGEVWWKRGWKEGLKRFRSSGYGRTRLEFDDDISDFHFHTDLMVMVVG